jgi:prephenate dehydrogenase
LKEDDFTIVGLGLIGSSLAAALRLDGARVRGFDPDPETRRAAQALGHIEVAADSLVTSLAGAGTVILAAPVPAILQMLPAVRQGAPDALILDVGSVKAPIVERMARLPGAERTVGGHPIAGKETSGPAAADPDLFRGRPFVLTPHAATSDETLERARDIAGRIGSQVVVTDAESHDSTVARTSHLPQSLSSVLAGGLAAGDGSYAGPGLRDMTRLATSDPSLWTDILLANNRAVASELRGFATRVLELAEALEIGDAQTTARVLREGRKRALAVREQVAA